MSSEAFSCLPYRLGWKHEYFGGMAHVTPGHLIILATLTLAPRPVDPLWDIRPVSKAYERKLIAGFFESFVTSVEYCDQPITSLCRSAHEAIRGYFEGRRWFLGSAPPADSGNVNK